MCVSPVITLMKVYVLISPDKVIQVMPLVALETASTSIDSQALEFIQGSSVSILMNAILPF